jgi:hypothetical protein
VALFLVAVHPRKLWACIYRALSFATPGSSRLSRRFRMETLDVFIRTYGYPALFGGMVIEQFVPPMAGEPILLGAGAL